MRERVHPRIISPSTVGTTAMEGVAVGFVGWRRRRARVSASLPSRISQARMASICSKGGPTSPLKMMAELVATLVRWPRGTASSAEKEQLEELGGWNLHLARGSWPPPKALYARGQTGPGSLLDGPHRGGHCGGRHSPASKWSGAAGHTPPSVGGAQ